VLQAYAVRKIRRTEATKKQQQDTDADATSFNVSVNELAKPDMFGLYGLAVDDKRAQPPYVCIAEKLLKKLVLCCRTLVPITVAQLGKHAATVCPVPAATGCLQRCMFVFAAGANCLASQHTQQQRLP
jgi:hypothetical protein